jgi:hypothetical protein
MGWTTESPISFTVLAGREQAECWRAAAHLQAWWSTSAWLARTADAYLEEIGKTGKALSLAWSGGWFQVLIYPDDRREPYEIEVKGRTYHPFGIFRGSLRGLDQAEPYKSFSLVHLPTRRILRTLSRQKDCAMLAAELMPLRINWDETDPEKVVQGAPDQARLQETFRLYEIAGR